MSYPNVAALRNGMLVAVSLNAAVSTAFVDPELDQMANKLETGKYLAILSGLSVDQDGNSLTNMYFIGKGMPRHDSQYDEDETMSIPVLPNKAHPLRRQPLQLQQPLPWPGCYIRTLVTERQVRINSVTPSKTASVNMLQATDFKPLISLCETDLRRAKPSEIVVSASDNGFESDGSSAVDHDDDDWDMETHSRASELTLTFDVWLDTGVFASGLPDPSHLRTELERLYILQERDTRRYKARHKRKKRVERAEMRSLPPPETVTEQKKKSPKRKVRSFRSWISLLFRKLFRKHGD